MIRRHFPGEAAGFIDPDPAVLPLTRLEDSPTSLPTRLGERSRPAIFEPGEGTAHRTVTPALRPNYLAFPLPHIFTLMSPPMVHFSFPPAAALVPRARTAHANRRLKVQLSIFMFLQYYIWGSWYASMGAYLANTLKFDGEQIGHRCSFGAFAIRLDDQPRSSSSWSLIAEPIFRVRKAALSARSASSAASLLFVIPHARTRSRALTPLDPVLCHVSPCAHAGSWATRRRCTTSYERQAGDFPRVKIFSRGRVDRGGVTRADGRARAVAASSLYLAGGISIVFGLFVVQVAAHPSEEDRGERVGGRSSASTRQCGCLKKPTVRGVHRVHVPDLRPALLLLVNMAGVSARPNWNGPNFARRLVDDACAGVGRGVFLGVLPVIASGVIGYKWTIA